MLLNTRFFVDSLDRRRFFEMMTSWLRESEHHCFDDFDFSFDDEEEKQFESENHLSKLFIGNFTDRFIMQLVTVKDDITYTSNFVLDDVSEKGSLHLSIDHSFSTMTVNNLKPRVYLPKVLNSIFWEDLGGDDNGILTDDKPLFIRRKDVDFALDILLCRRSYLNPIVYVSPSFRSGVSEINCEKVAHELMGQAHVVVESSPLVTKIVSETVQKIDRSIPTSFDGAVKIILPGGQSQILLPKKESSFDYTIINTVRRMMASANIPPDFDFVKIRQNHLLHKFAGSVDKDVYAVCEQIIEEKDSEINRLNEELKDAKLKLFNASSKANRLQDSFSKSDCEGSKSVSLLIDGDEMYQGEIVNVILKVLRSEYDRMKDDATLSMSRKFDVLGDVLEHNFPPETDIELSNIVKGAFKEGTLTRDGIGSLRAAGFVVERGSKHYKVYKENFEKYFATVSVTPSDPKSLKNTANDFLNMLF